MGTQRTALVTGASRGIGRGTALTLANAGWAVAINYHRNAEAAQECARLVEQGGGKALIVRADVGAAADRQRLVDETLARFGAIDLLVNNAGVAPRVRADLLETGEESFDYLLHTNLRGPFFLTQLVARHMIAQLEARLGLPPELHPAIINISSISAYTASVNRGEYCLSKAGVAMMTALFATRLAEYGINVYEIRPGIIATDMTGPVKAKYDKLIGEGLLPLARWGQPEDIGKAVLAIASGLLPYSTGQVLDVDGGFHLRRL
jgi:NAD(P)-dependent dehydrogenase (short-subunit alcohol dehydrogenase family)